MKVPVESARFTATLIKNVLYGARAEPMGTQGPPSSKFPAASIKFMPPLARARDRTCVAPSG